MNQNALILNNCIGIGIKIEERSLGVQILLFDDVKNLLIEIFVEEYLGAG